MWINTGYDKISTKLQVELPAKNLSEEIMLEEHFMREFHLF